MLYSCAKKQMEEISCRVGQRPDYVQGGGGNTSVKFDNRLMAIKASGYSLKEITDQKGYITVDYQQIKQYYNTVDVCMPKDYEEESLKVNLSNIVLLQGMDNRRPSVEVGFHSILKKYVIHTHSVYANILCCSEQGKTIAQEIFGDNSISYMFVPYIDPGFRLTLALQKKLEAFKQKNDTEPDAIFLANHGIIVSHDNYEKVICIHEAINNRIKAFFNLPDYYEPKVRSFKDFYQSNTNFLREFLIKNNVNEEYLKALQLYPDQLVYVSSKLIDVISFNNDTKEIAYKTTKREAEVIEETLLGIAYVITEIRKAGLKLKQMSTDDADFIRNWEGEKYRAKICK